MATVSMQPVAASVERGWVGSAGGAHGQSPPSPDTASGDVASAADASAPPDPPVPEAASLCVVAPWLVQPPVLAVPRTNERKNRRKQRCARTYRPRCCATARVRCESKNRDDIIASR